MSQRVPLDDMDEGSRLADRWNQVEPAPCGQMATLVSDRCQICGDRVEATKIVEQPGVDLLAGKSRLDGGDINRRSHDSSSHLSSISRDIVGILRRWRGHGNLVAARLKLSIILETPASA